MTQNEPLVHHQHQNEAPPRFCLRLNLPFIKTKPPYIIILFTSCHPWDHLVHHQHQNETPPTFCLRLDSPFIKTTHPYLIIFLTSCHSWDPLVHHQHQNEASPLFASDKLTLYWNHTPLPNNFIYQLSSLRPFSSSSTPKWSSTPFLLEIKLTLY